jgi:hypothetical protein
MNDESLKMLRINDKTTFAEKSIFELFKFEPIDNSFDLKTSVEKDGVNFSNVPFRINCFDNVVRIFNLSAISLALKENPLYFYYLMNKKKIYAK